jgi:hypothetical protein
MFFWSRAKDHEARYLSNFAKPEGGVKVSQNCPAESLRGLTFPSVEAAFQAAKTDWSSGEQAAKEGVIDRLKNASIDSVLAKRMGTRAAWEKAGLKLDCEAWNEASILVMEDLIRSRAAGDPPFAETIKKHRELHHYDRFGLYWGCYTKKTGELVGQDHLGQIYQRVAHST